MVGMKGIGLEALGNTTSTVRIFKWIDLNETTIFPSNRSFDWNAIGFADGVHSDAEVKRITSSTGHTEQQTTTNRKQQRRRRNDRHITEKGATTPSADTRETEREQRQTQQRT